MEMISTLRFLQARTYVFDIRHLETRGPIFWDSGLRLSPGVLASLTPSVSGLPLCRQCG